MVAPAYRIARLLVYPWGSQTAEMPANLNQRTKFNLFINHVIGLLRLDITNCDFIKNTAHKVYLNIPIKYLCKNKLKTRLHNKKIWNFIRPFLINKSSLNSCEIMIRKQKKIITDTKEIVQVLNDHYVNIVERSCWKNQLVL